MVSGWAIKACLSSPPSSPGLQKGALEEAARVARAGTVSSWQPPAQFGGRHIQVGHLLVGGTLLSFHTFAT